MRIAIGCNKKNRRLMPAIIIKTMDESILKNYLERIRLFLDVENGMIYRDYIPLNAELAVTDHPVPFAERMALSYKPIHERETWGFDWASGWFHLTAEVPESFAGKELCLLLHIGGEGLLFDEEGVPAYGVTGYSVFLSPYAKERYVLKQRYKAGEKLDFWLEGAANGLYGCPLTRPQEPGLLVATEGCGTRSIRHLRLCVFDRELWSMFLDIRTLYHIAKTLGLKDYRARRILRVLTEAMECFNYHPENAAVVRKLIAEKAFSCKAASTALTACTIGHGHIDVGWLWPVSETIRKAARTFSNQIALMEKYPNYVYGASQAVLYDIMKRNYPKLYEKVKGRVKEGRWEVQGGMWVEADVNITNGESLIRQFIHGKNFFKDEFGIDVRNLWLPDAFGYSWSLPQIIRKSGCEAFLTQKLCQNWFTKHPYHSFRWIGVDGSSVLAHFPPEDNYNAWAGPEQRIPAQDNYLQADVSNEFISLIGIGDGGGGPSEEFVENNLRQADLDACPKAIFGRADEYFKRLEKVADKLPEWHNELYFEKHRGTYTSQARVKRGNRKIEQALPAVEFLWSALPLKEYPAAELDALWKTTLINQFHDILPGSSIRKVYDVTEREHKEILAKAGELSKQAAARLFSKDDDSLTLVNTLSVEWKGAFQLPDDWTNGAVDSDGAEVPVQSEAGHLYALLCLAPQSFTTLRKGAAPAQNAHSSKELVLENNFVKYTFDRGGRLVSAYDKAMETELLAAPANVLSLYNDRPQGYDAWELEIYYRDNLEEQWQGAPDGDAVAGPVRSVLSFNYNNGRSTMRQTVSLSRESRRLDFETHIDWREEQMILRVAFPVNIHSDSANYDIQYAFIPRTTHDDTTVDRAKYECVGQRYADLSDREHGIAILNDCKYGYRVKGNVIELALLRATRFPDDKADIGEHDFTYSFLPHVGALHESDVMDEAARLNRAPLCFNGFAANGVEPICRQIAGDGISLEIVKKAERENDVIVRVVEKRGMHSSGLLRWRRDVARIVETNLIEWEKGAEAKLSENMQEITLAPFEIKTFRAKL